MIVFLFVCLFLTWKAQLQRGGKEEGSGEREKSRERWRFYSVVHLSITWPQWPRLDQTEARSFLWLSHKCAGTKTLTTLSYLPVSFQSHQQESHVGHEHMSGSTTCYATKTVLHTVEIRWLESHGIEEQQYDNLWICFAFITIFPIRNMFFSITWILIFCCTCRYNFEMWNHNEKNSATLLSLMGHTCS